MPPKSKKQERFMQAVANNPEFAKKVGVPTKVGKEFTKETKVKKYKEGGMTDNQEAYAEGLRTGKGIPILRSIDKGLSKMLSTPKEREMLEKGYQDMLKAKKYKKKAVKKAGGKIGMGMTKNNYKKGGKVSSCSKRADGCAVKGKTKGRKV